MNSKEAYQWFSIAGVNDENRFSRIKEARAHFDQKIQEIINENQLENHLDKVVFFRIFSRFNNGFRCGRFRTLAYCWAD